VKKITTKVILLMLIIPLLLVFTMVTTIDMTSIMVDIPVTSVEIEGEEILFVDVNQENNFVKLNTVVNPKEATNKGVTYSIESTNGDKLAIVDISKDGIVSPKSAGTVKVIATADGGRQDSVQINFYSTKVNEVEQITETINLDIGEKKRITLGADFNVYPSNASESNITYTSNSNKIKIDKYSGEITGLFVGESTVTANVEGVKYDESSNKFIDKIYSIDFKVVVESDEEQSVLSFAGGKSESEEVLSLGTKVVPFEYLGNESLGLLSYAVLEEDEEYIEKIEIEYLGESSGNIKITLKSEAPEKDYLFTIKAGETELGKLTIKKQNPTITISTNKTTFAKSNANVLFGSVVDGLEEGYDIRYESSDSNVFYVNVKENDCVGKARNEGVANISAKLYVDGKLIAVSDPVTFTVVNPYISIGINEATPVYGLENSFALGRYQYEHGTKSEVSYKLNVKVKSADGIEENIDNNKLKWSSSDASVAVVDSTGLVKVLKDGIVLVTVESAYNEVLQTSVKSSFEIICRSNGINVYDYEDLLWANQNNYETILMDNVMLADGINDINYRDYLTNIATKEMETTADKAYYDDNNASEMAKIRYCLEITSNVYGNGFFIDANNITRSIDKYNYSIFNGPLNLIALKFENNSNGNAKVKSQDNIVFLVKKDDISINNVELKGCSDSSLIESGQTNLGRLDNVGTVLEIVGDNTELKYSRVNNGRTVVRIYGKPHENDVSKLTNNLDNYKTETLISNCILSYGREFILKVGSNQIMRNESVYGDALALPSDDPEKYDHAAPYFIDENGNNYALSSAKDDYFINNYLMNDITLKDSIFFGAGLFCVGFESQFAGLALHGYDYGSFNFSSMGWQRVAGTSYPARIKMQGDVRFYDWKEVSKIDSGTLIEGDPSILDLVGLDLNVSNLLNKYNEKNPTNNFIYKYEGKDYINGAVVFYGGGKNYSWIDLSGVSENFNALNEFEVPVSYFGDKVSLIYYAAGKENFRFMTYSSNGKINYETQRKDLEDKSAYSWIVRK